MTSAARAYVGAPLRPQLSGITTEQWTAFIHALSVDDCRGPGRGKPRPFGAVGPGGALGAFAMRPTRLGDLGLMRKVTRSIDAETGGRVWSGSFVPPMTAQKFMTSPLVQYNALVESMRRYDAWLRESFGNSMAGMTRSGALALLHRLGPGALRKWEAHKEPSTVALFERANGLF